MQAVDFNPFTWDNSSKKIKSRVTSLELKSNSAEKINVSNLDNDIEILIPISSPPQNSTNGTQHNFLKPNEISVRSYYAELANVPVSLKLGMAKAGLQISLFIKFGKRPTINDFDHNFTIAFTSTCNNQTDANATCSIRDSSVTVIPFKPGFLYAGLLFKSPKNESQHSRQRRSCFGNRRERRSCVGVKDPPPKGFLSSVIPKYDPDTDANYTLTITQSSCLYWSENTEKWTAEGCRVKINYCINFLLLSKLYRIKSLMQLSLLPPFNDDSNRLVILNISTRGIFWYEHFRFNIWMRISYKFSIKTINQLVCFFVFSFVANGSQDSLLKQFTNSARD